jgi:formylglycine-generating enzyme required for sulfatase activity
VDGMVMSYIPAGTFQMGTENHHDHEKPVHNVTLNAFWMDQTEVTNAQYAMCVAAGSCRQPWSLGSYSSSSYYEEAAYADYPVIYVDWNRASAYCAWAGRRLPTEAEWEYAARGGLAGRAFPWGDSYDERLANHCDQTCPAYAYPENIPDDGYSETAPVGSYPANSYRLFDMAGNVWEWAADWFGPYSSAAVTNPSGPLSGETRVTRGGSWYNGLWECGVYSRYGRNPTEAYPYIGFRCVDTP